MGPPLNAASISLPGPAGSWALQVPFAAVVAPATGANRPRPLSAAARTVTCWPGQRDARVGAEPAADGRGLAVTDPKVRGVGDVRQQHDPLALMPDHPDPLTVTAHPHADSDPLDRGARMTLGDLLELRVRAALDLHQPVMTAHRDPPRGDVHALFDLLAARRVDDVTERDPGHGRAADLHRPGGGRRPVKASVRGARVVGSPARDRVLADPGDRDPSSARCDTSARDRYRPSTRSPAHPKAPLAPWLSRTGCPPSTAHSSDQTATRSAASYRYAASWRSPRLRPAASQAPSVSWLAPSANCDVWIVCNTAGALH